MNRSLSTCKTRTLTRTRAHEHIYTRILAHITIQAVTLSGTSYKKRRGSKKINKIIYLNVH